MYRRPEQSEFRRANPRVGFCPRFGFCDRAEDGVAAVRDGNGFAGAPGHGQKRLIGSRIFVLCLTRDPILFNPHGPLGLSVEPTAVRILSGLVPHA